jgi:hypothetical protein
MGVVKYNTHGTLPDEIAKHLPSPAQLKAQIELVKQEFTQQGKY